VAPEPQADCLFIADAMTEENGLFMRGELHLLAYMACLLNLYRGGSTADWGYAFYGTVDGAPFSDDLEEAFRALIDTGSIVPDGEGYRAIGPLRLLSAAYASLESLRWRFECVDASVASVRYYGSGIVREALVEEPVLRRARRAGTERKLFAEGSLDALYAHFRYLRDKLPAHEDLRIPSLLWIGSLYQLKGVEGTA
jgi:hypothetical protein